MAEGGKVKKGIQETPGAENTSEVLEVLGEEEFAVSVLRSDLPTILAFTAVWCAPCAWLFPYLEKIAASARGRLSVRTVDVDQVPALAERYRIGSVPIVLLIQCGEERARSVGVEPDRLRMMADMVTEDQDGPSRIRER
jgi:thioredoxin-like negative regulator of GroEL